MGIIGGGDGRGSGVEDGDWDDALGREWALG